MSDALTRIRESLARLTRHQMASEQASSGHDPQTRAGFRAAFYDQLADPAVAPEQLKAYFDANAGIDAAFMTAAYFQAADVAFCRDMMRSSNCLFTPFEPPIVTWNLLRAVKPLLDNASPELRRSVLVIATDCSYRPHAQVRQIAPHCYEILLGRFLVDSMIGLAMLTYDLLEKTREGEPTMPFETAVSGERLLVALQQSLHRYQLPYFLVSIFEGEKYRFGLGSQPSAGDPRRYARAFALHTLMVAFVLAHEFAHIELGHLEGGTPTEPPAFGLLLDDASPMRMRALDAIDPALVDAYRRTHLPVHALELGADMDATVHVMNCSIDLMRSKWPGLAAAGLVLSIIGLFDRMQCQAQTGHDPATAMGLQRYNAGPFIADILLPQPTHPWGKTRLSALPFGLMLGMMAQDRFHADEFEAMRAALLGVSELVGLAGAEAMAVRRWVAQRPGEWLAMLTDKGLYTKYYPADENDRHAPAAFYYDPASLYGMVDAATFHGPLQQRFPLPPWPPKQPMGY